MVEYIERKALIKDIESRRLVFKTEITVSEALLSQGKVIRKAIEEAPTADVEVVRHGYWKDLYDNKYDNQLYVCSECGGKALYEFYRNELGQQNERQVLTPVCPHCGAKMDGGKAE